MTKQSLAAPDQREFDEFATNGGFEKVFNASYSKAYALFSFVLAGVLKKYKPPVRILDIGCGDGWTVEYISSLNVSGTYLGIDTSAESIAKLMKRIPPGKKLKVLSMVESASWLTSRESAFEARKMLDGPPDLIICNAACHQIVKSFPELMKILSISGSTLKNDGTALVGDYYYPEDLSNEEIEEDRKWIKKTTGQTPTPRPGFISRNEMELLLKNSGYIAEKVREVRANRDISLIYYLFQLKPKAK